MLNWFRSLFGGSVDLTDHLRQTKKIKIKGVIFRIRKVNMEDHIAGYSILYQIYSTYDKGKRKLPAPEEIAKLKKFMRDFLVAGIVSPKITLKDPPGNEIHVGELMADMEMAAELCHQIIAYSNGKKN
jgi:hypothetical protein